MIELVLLACLVDNPDSCRDVGLAYSAENLTPMQCLMQAPPQMADIPDDWRELAMRALRHREQLSAWELDFLHSVTCRRYVSEKQWRVIQRLARRTGEL